jgi:hypothetical protein
VEAACVLSQSLIVTSDWRMKHQFWISDCTEGFLAPKRSSSRSDQYDGSSTEHAKARCI